MVGSSGSWDDEVTVVERCVRSVIVKVENSLMGYQYASPHRC